MKSYTKKENKRSIFIVEEERNTAEAIFHDIASSFCAFVGCASIVALYDKFVTLINDSDK